jgi:hypothetical protein
VRSIREGTNAQVTLVEAKPNLAGTPWMEGSKATTAAAQPAAPGSQTGATASTSK